MRKRVKGQGSRVKVFAVILVGGKGKRLKPLSTGIRPKAFLSITKDRKTMFKTTIDRLRKIIPLKNILASANKAHLKLIKKDFPAINKKNLILEPVSRNTAPAIGLAAIELKKKFSPKGQTFLSFKEGSRDAIMVVVPADQYVIEEKKYLEAIKKGIEFADGQDCLIVLGLKPTYPATGFGYVKIETKNQKPVRSEAEPPRRGKIKNIYKVAKFIEKPNLETAKRFVKDGRYFWNAGAFVFNVNSILRAIRELAPDIFSLLVQLNEANINKLYKNFPDISIDYAVMEKAHNLYCIKGGYRWRDIGSFEVLKEVLKRESRGFIEKKGKIIHIL